MTRWMKAAIPAALALALGACTATKQQSYDYTALRAEGPRSVLVLPAMNNTLNVNAPDFFLSTLSAPVGERGYYVFPAHMVRRTLEENGLADTGLVYEADTRRLGTLFGCDTALYVTIQRWDSQYVVLATQTTVEFDYEMRSCHTGESLWSHTEAMVYSPQQQNSSGNLLADLIVQAAVAAMEKAAPNYMPLTRQANAFAVGRVGHGLPAGPYLPETHGADLAAFPTTASLAAAQAESAGK